jgi:hypothetical protein
MNYKGKKILSVDYKGLNEDEMIKLLEEESALIIKGKENILYFGDFTNTVLTTKFVNRATELGKITEKLTTRGALVGITGMKAVLLNTYNMFTGAKMKAFAHEAEAKEYLVK